MGGPSRAYSSTNPRPSTPAKMGSRITEGGVITAKITNVATGQSTYTQLNAPSNALSSNPIPSRNPAISGSSSSYQEPSQQELQAQFELEKAKQELEARQLDQRQPLTAGQVVREQRVLSQKYPTVQEQSILRNLSEQEAYRSAQQELERRSQQPQVKTAGQLVREARSFSRTYNIPEQQAQELFSNIEGQKATNKAFELQSKVINTISKTENTIFELAKQEEQKAQIQQPKGVSTIGYNNPVYNFLSVGYNKVKTEIGYNNPTYTWLKENIKDEPIPESKNIPYLVELKQNPTLVSTGFSEWIPVSIPEATEQAVKFGTSILVFGEGYSLLGKAGKTVVDLGLGALGGYQVIEGKNLAEKSLGAIGLTFGVLRVAEISKTGYVKLGSKLAGGREIPIGELISPQVLEQGKTLPTSRSVAESIAKFKQATNKEGTAIIVSSASPSKIAGTEAGIGKKANLGLEDTGIYVTPKGEGSPYFLRVSGGQETSYTLNPIPAIKRAFNIPTFTEFEAKGILQYPREIINIKGFQAIKEFQEKQAEKGFVYLTKRSEIGLGNIEGNGYSGTSETEAVIPYKQQFEYKDYPNKVANIIGFKDYMTYEGVAIPIREAKLLSYTESTLSKNIVGNTIATERESNIAYYQSYTKEFPLYVALPSSILTSESQLKPSSYPTSSVSIPKYTPSNQSYSFKGSELSSKPIIRESSYTPPQKQSYRSSGGGSSSIPIPKPEYPTYVPPESKIPYIPNYPYKPTPINNKTPIEGIPRVVTIPKQKEKLSKQQYKVLVRSKGQFKTIGITSTIQEGVKLGSARVLGTASASFKLQPINQGMKENIKPFINQRIFYESKKEAGVFIQKRGLRISSVGEKKEITFKGIAQSKFKSASKSLFSLRR